ncbi:MAG: TonB-dependent receptor [Bacteroidota bacterium]
MILSSTGLCSPSQPRSPATPVSSSLNPAQEDSIIQFNQVGSFGLHVNGIRAAVMTSTTGFTTSYTYRNFDGYRAHNNDYSHNFDLNFETATTARSNLRVVLHYLNGVQKRPGSLTRSEFDSVPFQADPRAVSRDEKRITQKGQLDLGYDLKFGRSLNQKIEISGNGQIEYFERSTKEFKITTRYIMGLRTNYVCTFHLWNRSSEFTAGVELFHQPERKEEYENYSGQRSDQLEQIEVENTSIASCHLSDNFELVKKKLFILLTGRYDNVIYRVAEETGPSRSDKKNYHALTPEISLNYKAARAVTLFTSWEMDFKNPTDRELESPDPGFLYNQELNAQVTRTLKAGIRGSWTGSGKTSFFRSFRYDALLYRSRISNEIVRYEILGDEYYRNAARTNRLGVKLHGRVEIIRDLTFSVAYTYSHFIYSAYTAMSWEETTPGNIVTIGRDFSGNTEPAIPRHNLNLTLGYELPIGKKCGIFARLNYHKSSGFWMDDANSEKSGTCDLVNTMVGVNIKSGHLFLTVSGGVNNVFDRIYVVNANINSADRRFYDAGSPRDFTGSVNLGYTF